MSSLIENCSCAKTVTLETSKNKNKPIELKPDRFEEIIGTSITNNEINKILSSLGCSVKLGKNQIKVTDGAILPITDDDVDLGSSTYQFKNAYFDGTLEADAITIGGTAVTAGGATAGFALAMAVAL